MNFFKLPPIDKNVFVTAVLLILLLNIGQYFFGYGLVEGVDPWSLNFGFPFFYFEHGLKVRGLERILYLGIAGNFIFAVAAGCIAGVISALLKNRFAADQR
ncbi:MAG: hypothetical protein AB7J13_05160 [Pyrinomonadaceae bacterium]